MRALLVLLVVARAARAEPPPHVVAPVPSEALGFLGLDLEAARRSPALAAVVARVAREAGLDEDTPRAARSLVIAAVPGARAPAIRPGARTARRSLAFGAIWPDTATKQQLGATLADLAAITWAAGTLEVSDAGFVLAGSISLANAYAAAWRPVSIGMMRPLASTQLSPAVATAVDKIEIVALGATLRVRARWTAADLAAVLAMW